MQDIGIGKDFLDKTPKHNTLKHNREMQLHQAKKLLYIKENIQWSQKKTDNMGENICKPEAW